MAQQSSDRLSRYSEGKRSGSELPLCPGAQAEGLPGLSLPCKGTVENPDLIKECLETVPRPHS